MNLQDKTVVLTGANGGLGEVLAHQLAASGARLILVGMGQDVLDRLASELNSASARHCALDIDLSSEKGIDELVHFCRDFPSGIDVLINSAGLNRFALIEDNEYAGISKLMMVNLVAPMILTTKLLPMLKTRNEALIVNIGSALGAIGNPGYNAYCASKAGLGRFSETLRRELLDSRVKVLHLNPRVIRTAMNSEVVNTLNRQLGNRSDAPEDVARILLNRISKNCSGEYNIGWPEKLFIKINALLPALVDRNFYKNLALIKAAARSGTIPTESTAVADVTNS